MRNKVEACITPTTDMGMLLVLNVHFIGFQEHI